MENIEHVDDNTETYFDDTENNATIPNALRILRNRLWAIKVHNYHCKRYIRFLWKYLKLNKSPKKKGYGQFFTDEEKRYFRRF